jgi:hypothetical protein
VACTIRIRRQARLPHQQGGPADVFINGTLGPQLVNNTAHGGIALKINY